MSSLQSSPQNKLAMLSSAQPSVPFPTEAKSHAKDGPAPSLPPQMESIRSHTADEIIQMMKRMPLFMTSLDDAEAGGTLQSLKLNSKEIVHLNL